MSRESRWRLFPPVGGLPKAFWVIFAGWIVNRAAGFVAPFLALYLTVERHLGISEAGAIVSLYGLGSVASGPVGGVLADRIGRRPTLGIATVGGASLILLLGWVREPAAIAVIAGFAGFFEEMYRPPGMAAVTDLVPPEDRARAFGFMYWAANFGFAIATATAGFIATAGFGVLFIGDALATLVFGMMFVAFVPETRPEKSAGEAKTEHHFFEPYLHGVFLAFVFVSFLLGMIFFQPGSTFAMDLAQNHLPPSTYGALLALNGTMVVFLQPAATHATRSMSRARLMAAGALLGGMGMGVNAFAGNHVAIRVLGIVVFTLGEISMVGISPAVIADLAPTHLRGSYQGAHQMAWGAAAFLGPLGGSTLLARTGPMGLWGACALLGVLSAIGFLLVVPERRSDAVLP